MNDEPIQLMVRFSATEERLADFTAIMDGVATDMTTEPGFVAAYVYQNADAPREFVLVETWESRSLHEEHYDRIVESGDWARILAMLSEEPDMNYYRLR